MTITLISRLNCEVEKIDNPTGDIDIPGTWTERLQATIMAICGNDFQNHLLKASTWEGARVVLIGDALRSRAILIHPEDPPGLVHLAKDDGQMINLTWIEAEKAVWLGELLEIGYMSTFDLLDLGNYENDRLKHLA